MEFRVPDDWVESGLALGLINAHLDRVCLGASDELRRAMGITGWEVVRVPFGWLLRPTFVPYEPPKE